jgi:hypothetical protein
MTDKQKMILGWVFFGLSMCCMATWMSLPFSDFSTTQKATGITIFMILGKLTFAAATYFLGKPFVDKYKDKLMFWKKKPTNTPPQ